MPAWSVGFEAYLLPSDTVPQDSTAARDATFGSFGSDTARLVDDDSLKTTTQPQIIYYQSDPDDRRSHGSVRYKRRGGKRVKTLAGTMNHSGGFGALSFKSTSFDGETMVLGGVRGGWIVNRTLAIGLEGYGIIPTAKLDEIAPSGDVLALGGYGGMFLELIFFSNEVVHITFPVSGGAGWIGFDPVDENSNIQPPFGFNDHGLVDEDVFWYEFVMIAIMIRPGVTYWR